MLTVKKAAAFGIHAKVEGIDWPFIVKRAFEEVDADAAMNERGNRQADNIEVLNGSQDRKRLPISAPIWIKN